MTRMPQPQGRILARRSLLLLIDLQERLAPRIHGIEAVLANCERLLAAARRLDIPLLVTEQYPQGLGGTVKPLAESLATHELFAKRAFSSCLESGFMTRLAGFERPDIVVAGTESHVCVLQTVLDLLEGGYRVHVVQDACGSRTPENRQAGLDRMAAAGANLVTTEMVVFEWAERSDSPAFKALLELIK